MWAVSITTAVTVLLWSSPLVALRDAARELDVKRVPVPLTLVMLSTTLAWLIAGLLLGDMALIVCSAFGVFFSGLQLAVLAWIRMQPPPPTAMATTTTTATKREGNSAPASADMEAGGGGGESCRKTATDEPVKALATNVTATAAELRAAAAEPLAAADGV